MNGVAIARRQRQDPTSSGHFTTAAFPPEIDSSPTLKNLLMCADVLLASQKIVAPSGQFALLVSE
jgi:hypothetical protein